MLEKQKLNNKEIDKLLEDYDKALTESKKAMGLGKQQEIIRTQKIVQDLKEKLDKVFAGQKSTVKGMSPIDMRRASIHMDKKYQNFGKKEIASAVDNSAKDTSTKDNTIKKDTNIDTKDVVDSAKANTLAESNKTKEQVDKEAKQPEVQLQAEKTVKVQEDKKKELVNTANDRARSPKKDLNPKPWQRVSDEGTLVNVITFMGEKLDYEVGFKHRYRFPNLSVSDGLNRIVTAKFPKERYKPAVQEIEFREYKIRIEKYGSSAVCKMYDPDGICMLEFVSLATVIDVLQDELNPDNDCWLTWGTIDQIIKKKRGLRSRIKELTSDDLPANSRKFKQATEEVTNIEEAVNTEKEVSKEESKEPAK